MKKEEKTAQQILNDEKVFLWPHALYEDQLTIPLVEARRQAIGLEQQFQGLCLHDAEIILDMIKGLLRHAGQLHLEQMEGYSCGLTDERIASGYESDPVPAGSLPVGQSSV